MRWNCRSWAMGTICNAITCFLRSESCRAVDIVQDIGTALLLGRDGNDKPPINIDSLNLLQVIELDTK